MHELQIVKKIVDIADEAAKKEKIESVSSLKLRIGKMSGIDPEQLNFLFKTYEKGAALTNAVIEVDEVPVELECQECKHAYIDERFDDHEFAHSVSHAPLLYEAPSCPKCGANGPQIIHGEEFNLVNLEGN